MKTTRKPEVKPRNGWILSVRQRQRNNDLMIGTWDIRTIYQPQYRINSLQKIGKYYLDITTVHEIKWPGKRSLKI